MFTLLEPGGGARKRFEVAQGGTRKILTYFKRIAARCLAGAGMERFGIGFLVMLCVLGIAALVALSPGANVTVVTLSHIDKGALDAVKDIFPVEEGVHCRFERCCKGEGGVASVEIATGRVMCASGKPSPDCFCKRRNLIRLESLKKD